MSYYQASLVCDYIDQKFGFPAIKKMLLLYKDGKNTADVFKEALGFSLEQFDTEFLKWVDDKVKDIEIKPFTQLMNSGEEALAKGDVDKAIEILTKSVEMYSGIHRRAQRLRAAGRCLFEKRQQESGDRYFEKIHDLFRNRIQGQRQAGRPASGSWRSAGARHALEGAMYIRPMDMEEHQKLGDLLLAQKQYGPGGARV